MQQLAAVLNGPDSPIYAAAFEADMRRERHASSRASSSRGRGSEPVDRTARKSGHGQAGSIWASLSEGFFRGG